MTDQNTSAELEFYVVVNTDHAISAASTTVTKRRCEEVNATIFSLTADSLRRAPIR